MSKKCKIIEPVAGPSQSRTVDRVDINWRLCIICQTITDEKLVDPSKVKCKSDDKPSGYKLLAENLTEFDKVGGLPPGFDISRLDCGGGIEATLKSNDAKWHKSCRNKFDNQKLLRAKKRKAKEDELEGESPVKTRRYSGIGLMERSENCFFCGQNDTNEKLHNAQTFQIDQRVREYAHVLQDRILLGKLSAGDMHALDARYHLSCLTALKNRYRKHSSLREKETDTNKISSIVLAEIVSYIEESRHEDSLPVFKLSDLGKLYNNRMIELGEPVTGRINTTRLKERILHLVPDLRAQTKGREVILMFDKDIGEAIAIACDRSDDDDAIHLIRAAEILRRDILSDDYVFNGSFKQNCEKDVVPESVLALVRMIMRGSSIIRQQDFSDAIMKVSLSLSQLLMFNVTKYSKTLSPSHVRHSKVRETPLPIYTGLLIHAKTRKKELVEMFADRGLSISYDRVQELSNDLSHDVCSQFERDGVVCPSRLKSDMFTVGAVDNIDHNPSSRSAMESFHGTAISLIQFPTPDNPGTDRDTVSVYSGEPHRKEHPTLPAEYTDIEPVAFPSNDIVSAARAGTNATSETSIITSANESDNEWLQKVADVVTNEEQQFDSRDNVSWSAYHADRQSSEIRTVSPIYLMPLFTEPAHSAAMILHAMDLVFKATRILNPEQMPVITMDQPLYSLGKQIQWAWPERFGENKYVVVMGGLHIEMNVLKLLGDLLTGSGWNTAIVQANITTSGRADAVLKGSHVTRSRYVHQVTAAALFILQVYAFTEYIASLDPYEPEMNFETWCRLSAGAIPQFYYWALVLKLELDMLQLVCAFREGNFDLYVAYLCQLVPWMFAFDHTNYSRWLPVHIRDMQQLYIEAPPVYQQFKKGHFVVQKSPHTFSTIALDHAHEQMNDLIKGDGGVIGITDNPSALIRWITAGPEIARIIDEFEHSFGTNTNGDTKHHDQSPSVQTKFVEHVKALVSYFEDTGNPFKEDTQDLITLDTKEVLPDTSVDSLKKIENLGKSQYETYVSKRLKDKSVALSDIIPKNNIHLFDKSATVKVSRVSNQIKSLKSNCELFSRMYISCQSRDGNMDEFFRHENQGAPPSLSDMGELKQCTKSDLLPCLDKMINPEEKDTYDVDAKLLDGSVVVNMLPPKACATFGNYCDTIFMPYILKQLERVKRLDIVWDRYIEGSLKSSTRRKRGSGNRLVVRRSTPIPKNWQSFLRVDENKSELYHFLSECIETQDTGDKELFSTHDTVTVSSQTTGRDISVSPSNHEEADTRLILHALDCGRNGYHKVSIRTVDTDIVVLAVSKYFDLSLEELWIAFGVKKNYRTIPIHAIAEALGEERARALSFFHALTGCDTVSSFGGIGKKTAWDTWTAYPEVTPTFRYLSDEPDSITDEAFHYLQRFVVLLYDRASECFDVDKARKHLFTKGRQLERIPPTAAALTQHIKRAVYQAGYCWCQALAPMQQLPNPGDWGWIKGQDNAWNPFWTTLPEAAKACKELIKCSCKKSCRRPCKCTVSSLTCTELCVCAGTCYQR